MIGQLKDLGRAYLTDDGIYLSVETVEGYGLLAQQSLDEMRSGGGDREVFGAEFKRHPADFVLWKFSKPDEPSWPSPWGDGRPGWHSECVVMSLDLLGEGFDLHCGGQDLRFPHHENERAQAVALGKRFANHWMHNGFVVDAEGEKMSKSLGNVSQPARPDRACTTRVRTGWCCCSRTTAARSRSPRTTSTPPVKAFAGLDSFAARTAGVDAGRQRSDVLDEFRAAMDDDLDTPKATALLFDTVRPANAALDAGDSDAGGARRRCAPRSPRRSASSSAVPPRCRAEVARARPPRSIEARAAKDFATADALRAELQDRRLDGRDAPETAPRCVAERPLTVTNGRIRRSMPGCHAWPS